MKIFHFLNSAQFYQHHSRPKAIFIREREKKFFIFSDDTKCTQISTTLKPEVVIQHVALLGLSELSER